MAKRATAKPKKAPKQRVLSAEERATMDRIENTLRSRGVSWSELARQCGNTPSAASQWSGRRAFPAQRTFNRIAEALGVTQSWLIKGEDDGALPQARTKRQAEAIKIMMEMTADQEAAALAAIQVIAAHMAKK
jgi:transcriptional regulator with XRE-family HTH domain